MEIKPLRSERDYERALARVEELATIATEGTADWDEMKMLSKMLEKYEDEQLVYINPLASMTSAAPIDIGRKIERDILGRK